MAEAHPTLSAKIVAKTKLIARCAAPDTFVLAQVGAKGALVPGGHLMVARVTGLPADAKCGAGDGQVLDLLTTDQSTGLLVKSPDSDRTYWVQAISATAMPKAAGKVPIQAADVGGVVIPDIHVHVHERGGVKKMVQRDESGRIESITEIARDGDSEEAAEET